MVRIGPAVPVRGWEDENPCPNADLNGIKSLGIFRRGEFRRGTLIHKEHLWEQVLPLRQELGLSCSLSRFLHGLNQTASVV